MVYDGNGHIWVACEGAGITEIYVANGGTAGTTTVTAPEAVTFDGLYIWVSTGTGDLDKIAADSGDIAESYVPGDVATSLTFDGTNVWLINFSGNTAVKIQPGSGSILGSYSAGHYPVGSVFDGTSLWVSSNADGTITQIRATK